MATERLLPWLWTPPAKNPVTNDVLVKAGGGVVMGFIAINLTVSLRWLGFFNPAISSATPTVPLATDLLLAFPIPASGSLIVLPQMGAGIVEAPQTPTGTPGNLFYAVYGGTDPTVIGAIVAGDAEVQIAYI